MDVWKGNGPEIEEVLGLFPRRPWYWPFAGTRHGSYRGYDVIVRLYPGRPGEAGPTSAYTTFQVCLDRFSVGPRGFRRVRWLSPRRSVRIGRYRFTADNLEELNDWLTGPRRAAIKRVMGDNWYVKRDWRQFVLHKFNYGASDVEKIRKGLDQLINTVEALISTVEVLKPTQPARHNTGHVRGGGVARKTGLWVIAVGVASFVVPTAGWVSDLLVLPDWYIAPVLFSFIPLSGVGGYLVMRAKRVRPRRLLGLLAFLVGATAALTGFVMSLDFFDGGRRVYDYAAVLFYFVSGTAAPWGLALALLPKQTSHT